LKEIINSVGIDIGTSTTQLIFSKLTIENRASSYMVPRIDIVDTEVIYKSDIYTTPLIDTQTIDAEAVKDIVKDEYKKAKMTPKDLKTGAVIITGETARKENANDVLSSLSSLAGDFVVATAGPDLESILSARGAGTDQMSKENRNTMANIDIGGGTSNIAVYNKGNLLGTSCLDIGGRLIKVENGKLTYIYEKTARMAAELGLNISVGQTADPKVLRKLTSEMAKQLAMAVGLVPKDSKHKSMYTNDGDPIDDDIKIDGITFSGGVADVVYNPTTNDPFRFKDIGPLLGDAIVEDGYFDSIKTYRSQETIRATVVGVGTHTTEVSGSTIRYDAECLPVKNIPVIKLSDEEEADLDRLTKTIADRLEIYTDKKVDQAVAIAFCGSTRTSFDEVQKLAMAIIEGIKAYDNPEIPIIIIIENDIGKVLGNALKYLIKPKRKLICIDNIFVRDGDYVDIGEPVVGGNVVPVVTKTLIFNR